MVSHPCVFLFAVCAHCRDFTAFRPCLWSATPLWLFVFLSPSLPAVVRPCDCHLRLHGRCARRFSDGLPSLCPRIAPLPPASVSSSSCFCVLLFLLLCPPLPPASVYSSSSCVALFLLLLCPLPPASSFCSLGGCRESPWGSFITRLGEFIYSPRRVSSLP